MTCNFAVSGEQICALTVAVEWPGVPVREHIGSAHDVAELEALKAAARQRMARLGRGEITLTRYDLVIKPVDERIASLRAEHSAVPDPGPSQEHSSRWERAVRSGGNGGTSSPTRESGPAHHGAAGQAPGDTASPTGQGSAVLDDVVGRVSVVKVKQGEETFRFVSFVTSPDTKTKRVQLT